MVVSFIVVVSASGSVAASVVEIKSVVTSAGMVLIIGLDVAKLPVVFVCSVVVCSDVEELDLVVICEEVDVWASVVVLSGVVVCSLVVDVPDAVLVTA